MLKGFIKFLIKLLWWWVCGYRVILIWTVYATHDVLHSVLWRRNIPRCPAEFASDHRYWATANLAAATYIRFIHRQRQALEIAWPDDATPPGKPSVVPVMSLPPGVRLIIWEYAFESYPENRAMVLAACSSRSDDIKCLDFPDRYHILRRWKNPMMRISFETREFAMSRYVRGHVRRRHRHWEFDSLQGIWTVTKKQRVLLRRDRDIFVLPSHECDAGHNLPCWKVEATLKRYHSEGGCRFPNLLISMKTALCLRSRGLLDQISHHDATWEGHKPHHGILDSCKYNKPKRYPLLSGPHRRGQPLLLVALVED